MRRWRRRRGKYREHSNLLDPPIALDKATASTKISGEQCTRLDSDRVKCHYSLPALPTLRRVALSCSPATRSRFRFVLAAFLLPPPFFFFIRFRFPPLAGSERTGKRFRQVRNRRARSALSPSATRQSRTSVTESSRYRSSSLPYVMRADVARVYL